MPVLGKRTADDTVDLVDDQVGFKLAQVLREIPSPIACGSADIPCNRGNSFCCCVDSNQTYVS